MLEWLTGTGLQVWGTMVAMAPYLLMGFLAAGVLSVLVSAETVERHLGGQGLWPSLKAAIFGVPLPLCSCGVIPVAAGLRRHGASRGATTAFLISTPETGVDSILVTLSLLGPVFAIFRPVAALISGVLGGAAVTIIEEREKNPDASGTPMVPCTDACCKFEPGQSRLKRALHFGFVTLAEDLAPSLVIGLLIAGLISVALKPDSLPKLLGSGILPMLVMMVVGLPVYVCATASVPVAAALMTAGLSPGAALVFLMTGPATNAATIVTVWKILGRRTAIVYLAAVGLTALAAGFVLDALFSVTGRETTEHVHEWLPEWVRLAAAVTLAVVLGYGLLRRYVWKRATHAHAPETHDHQDDTVTLQITGMHCNACVETVKRELGNMEGVHEVQATLSPGRAVLTGHGLDPEKLKETVAQLGYRVVTFQTTHRHE